MELEQDFALGQPEESASSFDGKASKDQQDGRAPAMDQRLKVSSVVRRLAQDAPDSPVPAMEMCYCSCCDTAAYVYLGCLKGEKTRTKH